MNHQISTVIIDIIRDSSNYCIIATPYFKPWNQLIKTLELVSCNEKRILFLFRDDQKDNDDIRHLYEEYDFDIFFITNLHAKIYLNEKQALISSMNLYDYSKENNFEIGYLINNANEVKDLAEKYIFGEIAKTWRNDYLEGRYSSLIKNNLFLKDEIDSKNEKSSFCIRCRKNIIFNFNRAYCNECFNKWKIYRNYEYKENYCHYCGKEGIELSMKKPLCYECFLNYIKCSSHNKI